MFLIRNLLDNNPDLDSDGEDEDEFVPTRKELQSSSEEEEGDGEEEAELDSDEEVVAKKSRRVAAGCRTPRSKQKARSSTRTPRKTPSRKVSVLTETQSWRPARCSLTSFLFLYLDRSHRARHGPPVTPRPASPAGRCRPDSQQTSWRRPEPGEHSTAEPCRSTV